MGVSKNLVYLLHKPILMPFKDSLTLLEEKQTHNFWVHIRKEHKILVITHSCSLFWNIFKQAKNEQTLRPETSAHPFCPSCFFRPFRDSFVTLGQKPTQNFWAHIPKERKILKLTKCFWLSPVAFIWLKNEQIFCAKTF